MEDLEIRAKHILESSLYLTMSTVGSDGSPWVSPVYCAYDEHFTFYWTSSPRARHSQNIAFNNSISFVIFDSHMAEGTGEGIYFDALAYEMNDSKKIAKALKIFYARKHKKPRLAEAFLGAAPRRLYKAVPQRVWLNDTENIDGYILDRRIEVRLI